MARDTFIVGDLKRTYGYQGKSYGPGINMKIPAGLAATLGIQPKSEAPKKAAGSKEKAPQNDVGSSIHGNVVEGAGEIAIQIGSGAGDPDQTTES